MAASKSELSYQFKILTGNLQILTSFVTHSKFICRASLLSTETQKGQVSAGFYSLAGLNPNQWPELPFRFRLKALQPSVDVFNNAPDVLSRWLFYVLPCVYGAAVWFLQCRGMNSEGFYCLGLDFDPGIIHVAVPVVRLCPFEEPRASLSTSSL